MAAVVIFVVSKFDNDLPISFLIFHKAQPLSFSCKLSVSPNRAARVPAALISFSEYWEHGASLAVWLVLAAAETRSVGRNRCFYSPAVAVSWFEKAKPAL